MWALVVMIILDVDGLSGETDVSSMAAVVTPVAVDEEELVVAVDDDDVVDG